ncbi:MAG TPA: phosphotransferase family protein [Pseudomonadales bacterium]|nr:phosphotransferase family protein [Pseudomonadales bacterium]
MTDTTVLTAVRPGHEFDVEALQRFLRSETGGFEGPLAVRQFEGGQSNPTFLLACDGREYVLRKQPPGELLPSAHQVDREYRVMKALGDTDVPVPKMIAACEDTSIIGTKFYVMEKVEGRVLTDLLLTDQPKADRRAIYLDLVSVLAKLHAVDPEAVGLGDFGRPGNYYTRQISRWSRQYEASKTEDLEAMNKLMAWLPDRIPESDESGIVHGDYRLGNVILHPTEPRIVAVLDWELCTLGHPLADLGYLCMDYHSPGYDGQGLGVADLDALGIPTEDEMLARYCELTGRDQIENWTFYLVYNLFRSGAIIQGVYKRGLDGNASSEAALGYKDACRMRSELAWQLVVDAGLA